MIFISWSREPGKLILRNYFPSIIFTKRFIVDVWHRRCLNKPCILNMLEFWIYHGSKYTKVLNMFVILNMLEFWIHHGSKYARVTQGFEYAWIISRHAWLGLNMSKSVWMFFLLHLPTVIPYLKEPIDRFLGE